MADPSDELERILGEVASVEDEIARMIEKRAALSVKLKGLGGVDPDSILLARRELETMNRVRAGAQGPLPARSVEAVFTEILAACRALEAEDRVAVLGPESDFGEVAALERFGSTARTVVLPTVRAVFEEVERRRAVFGVAPLETTSEGLLHQALDLLLGTSLSICGEIEMETSLHLLSRTGNAADVEKVYGHGSALTRCRGFLE